MRKWYKRLLLIFVFLLSSTYFIACRKDPETVSGPAMKQSGIEDSEDKEASPTVPVSEQQNRENSETGQTDDTAIQETKEGETGEQVEMRDIPSTELVKEIIIGWNLGNTMDATGGNNTLNSETSWGNPRTTKKMIDAVKEAGFQTLRIPTTWENHLGPAPDYLIDPAWLDRVQEIVDYGIENDMYVILNMHHEEWHFPSYDNLDKAEAILTGVWSQIAERFQNYDEHLIFEGMNEPRMKGTNLEWIGGNEEGRDVINQLNAAFVETIRSSEGNNPMRHLMIPCYAASSDPKTWADFVVPEDDKIIVSIHAYTPYNFALNKNGTSEWSLENENDTRDIDNLMNNIYSNFISKGQPVILGEFGAMTKKDNLDDRIAWAEYYVKKATEKGIPCIWWDNGAFYGSGELFGLLKRMYLKWEYPEIVDAMMRGLE